MSPAALLVKQSSSLHFPSPEMRMFGKLLRALNPSRHSHAVPATHVAGYEDRVTPLKEVVVMHNFQSI
jgi:hypothetical protein